MKSICEHVDGNKSSLCVNLHERGTHLCIQYVLIVYLNNVLSVNNNLYNRENEVGPDSKHVPYFIIHCDFMSVITNKC